jgi:spore germination protein GerM
MTQRRTRVRGLTGLAVAATLLASACGRTGSVIDVGAAPTRVPEATSPAPPDPETDGTDGGTDDAAPPQASEPAPLDMTTVTIYLTRGETLAAVPRRVVRVARIGRAAVEQLLAGPTPQETADGYGTAIPAGTRLRDLVISDGVATVDLSGDFEEGGGTLGLTLRLAQVACTLDEFPTVQGVRFALDGTLVDVFSGDGLPVDEPVACDDYGQVVTPTETSSLQRPTRKVPSREGPQAVGVVAQRGL